MGRILLDETLTALMNGSSCLFQSTRTPAISMSMGGGEGEFVVMLVVGIKNTTLFRQEEGSSRVKIRLEQPRLRDKDEVWVSVCTDVEQVMGDSFKTFTIPC